MKKKLVMGVDIGGTDLKLGLVNEQGRIVHSLSRPTEADQGKTRVLKNIITAGHVLLKEAGCKKSGLLGVGAGTPGLVNQKGTVTIGAANIKGWNGVPLGKELNRAFGVRSCVENDVTALTEGEILFGSGRGFSNAIVLAFGTGLGGGIVINNEVYRGKAGYAGEIGHMKVDGRKDAPKCTCGKRGCLEIFSSAIGLKRILKKHRKDYSRTSLSLKSTPKDIFVALKNKDPFAGFLVGQFGYWLGIGLSSLVVLFDPEIVILGGGISRAGKPLFDSFKPSYEASVLPYYLKNKVRFLPAKFGSEGGIVGTASLILKGSRKNV